MLIILGLSLISFASATIDFRFQDCCTDETCPHKIVHFANEHLVTYPVQIPGTEAGDIDVQILQDVSGDHYTLDVVMKKHVLFGYIGIPCQQETIGTCSYHLCDLLSGKNFNTTHHCPLQIEETTPDFPCTCPFKAGTYHLNRTAFKIPELSGFWKFLAEGDYHVRATITDTDTGEMVACYELDGTTDAVDCNGLGCLFGK